MAEPDPSAFATDRHVGTLAAEFGRPGRGRPPAPDSGACSIRQRARPPVRRNRTHAGGSSAGARADFRAAEPRRQGDGFAFAVPAGRAPPLSQSPAGNRQAHARSLRDGRRHPELHPREDRSDLRGGTAAAIGARSRAPRERRTMVHGPVAGVVHRPLRAGHPGYGRIHRSHQFALDGALRHAAASAGAHLLADCLRHRSRRRPLRPGDAPARELRRPGGCAFRGASSWSASCTIDQHRPPARRWRSDCSSW